MERDLNRHSYDVLVFPVVDWHERFQRYKPQLCEIAPNVFWTMLPDSMHPPDIYAEIPSELQEPGQMRITPLVRGRATRRLRWNR